MESDAEALVDNFQRNAPLVYIVTAETGDLGVSFSGPYTGMQIEVSEVLNKAKENEKVEQALTRCATLAACCHHLASCNATSSGTYIT